MERLLTIGVYGWTPETWLAALRAAGCDMVVDIRARRGVRGAEFAFANRRRLEAALADAGMSYLHLSALAPTKATRASQAAVDQSTATRKRDRANLAADFIGRYEVEIADRADWAEVTRSIGGRVPALLCVERLAPACHRSLAAARIAAVAGVVVENLEP